MHESRKGITTLLAPVGQLTDLQYIYCDEQLVAVGFPNKRSYYRIPENKVCSKCGSKLLQ